MDDKSIDIVVTSPPYNMNLRIMNGKYCSRQVTKEFSTKYNGFSDNLPIEEFYELHSSILKELIRVGDIVFYNIQIVTGSKRAFFKMIGDFSDNLKDIIVWDKGHGQPAMQSNVLNSRTELLLIFEDEEKAISRMFSKCNFGRGTEPNIWEIPRGKRIKGHGATFPEQLVERILRRFGADGDTVYDPFMGTGTTGKVAKEMNMNFIGSEISEEYFNIAKERIN
jgi:site-specific DNA-methyltransferase (adenine-specific)/modification methylase